MPAPTDSRPHGPRDWKCDYNADHTGIHVRPRNDHIWHTLEDDCLCGPTVCFLASGDAPFDWMYLHHALDGRPNHRGPLIPATDPTSGDDDPDGHAGCSA